MTDIKFCDGNLNFVYCSQAIKKASQTVDVIRTCINTILKKDWILLEKGIWTSTSNEERYYEELDDALGCLTEKHRGALSISLFNNKTKDIEDYYISKR